LLPFPVTSSVPQEAAGKPHNMSIDATSAMPVDAYIEPVLTKP
jgi:hypothetical protein